MSVWKHSLESETFLEVFNLGAGISESEELLGGDDDQRFSEVPSELASEDVEVLSCCRAVHNLPVHLHYSSSVGVLILIKRIIFVAKLEVSLDSARAVLGSLSVVTVRE